MCGAYGYVQNDITLMDDQLSFGTVCWGIYQYGTLSSFQIIWRQMKILMQRQEGKGFLKNTN